MRQNRGSEKGWYIVRGVIVCGDESIAHFGGARSRGQKWMVSQRVKVQGTAQHSRATQEHSALHQDEKQPSPHLSMCCAILCSWVLAVLDGQSAREREPVEWV